VDLAASIKGERRRYRTQRLSLLTSSSCSTEVAREVAEKKEEEAGIEVDEPERGVEDKEGEEEEEEDDFASEEEQR
jgi:hypothetical protein